MELYASFSESTTDVLLKHRKVSQPGEGWMVRNDALLVFEGAGNQFKCHEDLIGNLVLRFNTVVNRGNKTKSRVILRMSEHDYCVSIYFSALFESGFHQL